MFCKYCGSEMEQGENRCPKCGKDNGTALKIVLAAIAGVLVVAVLAMLVMIGTGAFDKDKDSTTGTTEPAGTVPADGDPNNETCKGTYSGTDDEALAAKDNVVATLGEHSLTAGQFQVYYWMAYQQYYSYSSYYDVDFSKPLDQQIQNTETGVTWQQFFVASALEEWQWTMILCDAAAAADYKIPDQYQSRLDSLDENMAESASESGFASVDEMIQEDFGVNTNYEAYKNYMVNYYTAYLYQMELVENMEVTDEEIEQFFTDNEAILELYYGITKDSGYYVNVRHILYMPDGATSETITTDTFDEAAWESANQKAKDLLAQWKKGEATEESFGELAKEHSMDGSASDGGLYEGVAEGDMVEAFNDWIFDETRKHGDTDIVKTEYGYHIMFFVGTEDEWIVECRNGVRSEKYSAWETAQLEANPSTNNYSQIVLASFAIGS